MHGRSLIQTAGLAVLCAFVACGGDGPDFAAGEASDEGLDRAEVRLPALSDSTVTLERGLPADPGRRRYVSRIEGVEARADFDGDGEDERAVLVTANAGGPDVWVNVVAFGSTDAGLEQEAVLQLGEEVRLHGFEALGDTLVLVVADASRALSRSTRRLRIQGTRWVDVSVVN